MKKRNEGFLAKENIDQTSEQFDYIKELHNYLWEFVRCELPSASGNLTDYLDIAIKKAKNRKKQITNYD